MAVADEMLTITRRPRRDRGKHLVLLMLLETVVDAKFRKRRASPVLEDSRSKRR